MFIMPICLPKCYCFGLFLNSHAHDSLMTVYHNFHMEEMFGFLHETSRFCFALFHMDRPATQQTSNKTQRHSPPSQALTSSGNHVGVYLG